MTRKTIGLIAILTLVLFACSGVPGLPQPTPTALPFPTDIPGDTPTAAVDTGTAEATETPAADATDQPTDEATADSSAEPTDAPQLNVISSDEAPNVKLLKEIKTDNGVTTIAISPNSDALAAAEGNSILIYNMPWPAGVIKLDGHTGKVNSISWSSDGTQLVSGSEDGSVRVWDTSTGKEQAKYSVDGNPVRAVAWSPDGTAIAAGSSKGLVNLIDPTDGSTTTSITVSKDGVALGAITWSSDGTELGTALYQGPTNPGDILLWDATTGDPLDGGKNARSYTAPGPTGIAWSPSDESLAWVNNGANGQVSIWAIPDDKTSVGFNAQNKVDTIAWAPDGDMIASGGEDHTIAIWDATDGTPLAQLKGNKDAVTTVAWSADGSFIVSASADGYIRIWGSVIQ